MLPGGFLTCRIYYKTPTISETPKAYYINTHAQRKARKIPKRQHLELSSISVYTAPLTAAAFSTVIFWCYSPQSHTPAFCLLQLVHRHRQRHRQRPPLTHRAPQRTPCYRLSHRAHTHSLCSLALSDGSLLTSPVSDTDQVNAVHLAAATSAFKA